MVKRDTTGVTVAVVCMLLYSVIFYVHQVVVVVVDFSVVLSRDRPSISNDFSNRFCLPFVTGEYRWYRERRKSCHRFSKIREVSFGGFEEVKQYSNPDYLCCD